MCRHYDIRAHLVFNKCSVEQFTEIVWNVFFLEKVYSVIYILSLVLRYVLITIKSVQCYIIGVHN